MGDLRYADDKERAQRKKNELRPHISWNLGSLHLPCFHVGYSIGGLISGASASAQAGSWARQERKGVWVSMRDWRNIEAKPKKSKKICQQETEPWLRGEEGPQMDWKFVQIWQRNGQSQEAGHLQLAFIFTPLLGKDNFIFPGNG